MTCSKPLLPEENPGIVSAAADVLPAEQDQAEVDAGRAEKGLGSLVLPAPTKREQVAALVSTPDDPWWDVQVLHAKLYPGKSRRGIRRVGRCGGAWWRGGGRLVPRR
ncbi:hypothetical protein [Kitasatospora aureofaciens]|uniref:hypothetical protein n=1 Tax=Kitasatospora aureofaciens TaxID=1894 RepID=UPI0037C7343C